MIHGISKSNWHAICVIVCMNRTVDTIKNSSEKQLMVFELRCSKGREAEVQLKDLVRELNADKTVIAGLFRCDSLPSDWSIHISYQSSVTKAYLQSLKSQVHSCLEEFGSVYANTWKRIYPGDTSDPPTAGFR